MLTYLLFKVLPPRLFWAGSDFLKVTDGLVDLFGWTPGEKIPDYDFSA